jgi:undecaprenyl-diphosphatase
MPIEYASVLSRAQLARRCTCETLDMRNPEIERAAEFLATHAVLLLGLGLLAAFISLLLIVLTIRMAMRFRHSLLRGFTLLVQHLQRVQVFNRFLARTRGAIPSAYLGLHLALGFLVAVAVMVFVALSEQIIAGGEIATFDLAFARALRAGSTSGWERFFSAISRLGSREVLTLATLVVAMLLIVTHRMLLAIGWVAGQAGGGLLNLTLKETFERTRPEFADAVLASSSWSFPSGHAMGTFVFCGLGCYLGLRERRRSWASASLGVSFAVAWCVVMAFSRLYLGAHYASDVIAGLLAGVAWVAVCASALEVVQRRAR